MPALPLSSLIAAAVAVAVTAALTVGVASGQPAPVVAEDLAALLARPMTPGAVALLAEHVAQPAVQKRLIEANKHEDPAVRAVAARIAFVSASKGLVPALITAVAKEEHTPTAVEQIRALMGLLGASGDNIVMRQVQRIGGPAAVVMAESLSRTRPADLVTHLPALVEAAGVPDTLGGPLAAAIAQHPASAPDIQQAVVSAKNEKLSEALSSARSNTPGPLPPAEAAKRTQVMRTIPVFAKGLLGDLLQVTGCRPVNEEHFAVGEVTYHPEGAAKSVSIVQMTLTKACERFVNAMMRLTIALAERPVMPGFADRIVLLFNRQYLACADDPFPPVRPRGRPDSTLTPPTVKKRPNIIFPRAAELHSMRGIVRLGVRISHTGCIGSAETLSSINPVLDFTAIRGVFTAQYTPSLIDGQAVETYMIYNVSFAP